MVMKVTKDCEFCGGTYDGTPSGYKRHQASKKHQDGFAAREAEAMVASANGSTFAEAVAKHTEQDASTGIQKVTAPDAYALGEDEETAREGIRQIRGAIDAANKRIKKHTADRKWRETRAPHLVGKYDELIAKDEEAIRLWDGTIGELALRAEAAEKERNAVVRDFWQGIGAELEEMFSTVDFPLVIRVGYEGSFDLLLATGKVIDGPHGQYPETRFGYDVHVTAPQRSTWSDTFPEAAKVNWGTIGSMSVADAETMLRLHHIAVAAARYLDERIDVPTK